MNQSLYLIDDSFFEDVDDLVKVWAKQIKKNCISEKATLVYDPICMPLFKKMVNNDKELKMLVTSYYSYFENNYKASLQWSELDMESVQYVDGLMELLYELDYKVRSVSAYGSIPLQYDKMTMHLFFFISPHYFDDRFYLVSEKDFIKNYKLIVDTMEMYGF